MWNMTPEAFVSIVQKAEDVEAGTLTVRSRDMRSLRAYAVMAGIEQDRPKEEIVTDYPFRMTVTLEEAERAAVAQVRAITYSNFKNEAKRVRGKVYAGFLGEVWGAGLRLTPPEVNKRIDDAWRKYTRKTKVSSSLDTFYRRYPEFKDDDDQLALDQADDDASDYAEEAETHYVDIAGMTDEEYDRWAREVGLD